MSEVKELVKDGSESERSSVKGSDKLRSVISPEMLQTNNLQKRGISVLFDPDTEEGLKEKNVNPANVDEFFQKKRVELNALTVDAYFQQKRPRASKSERATASIDIRELKLPGSKER